jgi:hypothetical protein
VSNPTAPWLVDGYPDELEDATAEALILGRFACGMCAENRDAAERMEAEVNRLNAQLAKSHALLRLIARTEQRPAKREGDEDARELALVGFAMALAAIKARIEIYFQAVRG